MTRGKGEGSVYKRASDGMWCTSIELPPGLDGKRRRKVVCRRDKAAALAELYKMRGKLDNPDQAEPEPTEARAAVAWQ